MQNTNHEIPWVVAGGKIGETGYCRRCGKGLFLQLPLPILEFTNGIKEFSKKHADCPPGKASEPKIETPWDWLASRWTGVSSATIWSVMMNFPSPYRSYDIPHDPTDFHRCHRLLGNFPEWTERLGEVGKKFPFWAPYVREWEHLVALFDDAMQNEHDGAPALYDRMKELSLEAEPLKRGKDRWTEEDVA